MPGAITGLRHQAGVADTMLPWLVGDCELFGLAGQNWMLLVAGGLMLYLATLVIARQRQARIRKRGIAL